MKTNSSYQNTGLQSRRRCSTARFWLGALLPVIAGALTGCTAPAGAESKPGRGGNEILPGDIVLHHSTSGQAVAIEKATGSKLTHCGIVIRDAAGKLRVAEAVQPVRVTSTTPTLQAWVDRSVNQKAVVYRLKDGLDAGQFARLWAAMKPSHGRQYDELFQWSDQKIYCSEFVYDAYLRGLSIDLGGVQQFADLDLRSAEVQKLIVKRYEEQGIPFDTTEKIITPVMLTRSGRLRKVTDLTSATAPLE